MSGFNDDLLSALGAVCSTLFGRALLFVLTCVLAIVASHATTLHEFVWPWEVLGEAAEMFACSFVLLFYFPLGTLAFAATTGFLLLFLWKDIHWGFLAIPFFAVWVLGSVVLAALHFR